MKRALMAPVFSDEGRELVNVPHLDGARHSLRELLHPLQREENLRIAALVRARDRRDRVARDARFAGVDDEASPLDLLNRLTSERDLSHLGSSIGEAEREGATERGRVVVLSAAGNSELLHLRRSAALCEGRWMRASPQHRLSASARATP